MALLRGNARAPQLVPGVPVGLDRTGENEGCLWVRKSAKPSAAIDGSVRTLRPPTVVCASASTTTVAVGSAEAGTLARALAEAEAVDVAAWLAGASEGLQPGFSDWAAGAAQAVSKSVPRMARRRCIGGLLAIAATVATRRYGQTAACAKNHQMAFEGAHRMLGDAMAAKPSTWRLMRVACGPPEVGPSTGGAEEWCAWARGPNRARLGGAGSRPHDALLALTAAEEL